jgi:hypothetical protein
MATTILQFNFVSVRTELLNASRKRGATTRGEERTDHLDGEVVLLRTSTTTGLRPSNGRLVLSSSCSSSWSYFGLGCWTRTKEYLC